MPIELRWADDQHTTILMQLIGKWTWDAFYEASAESYRMIDSANGSQKINTVLDWSKNATFPKDSLLHGRNLLNRRHPRQGVFVLSGMNRFSTGLYDVFLQLGSKTLKNFNAMTALTIEEAMTKLAQTDNLSS
jgi:hypothetical protein